MKEHFELERSLGKHPDSFLKLTADRSQEPLRKRKTDLDVSVSTQDEFLQGKLKLRAEAAEKTEGRVHSDFRFLLKLASPLSELKITADSEDLNEKSRN